MKLYGRQGDLVVRKLEKLDTTGFTARKDVVFAGDSSGRRHRVIGEVKIDASGKNFLVETATEMLHEDPSGHKSTPLAPGAYSIGPLRERGDQNDRAVED